MASYNELDCQTTMPLALDLLQVNRFQVNYCQVIAFKLTVVK